MKDHNGIKIIGIDHGYGNMKTANTCFPTGLIDYDQEPTFKQNLNDHLRWDQSIRKEWIPSLGHPRLRVEQAGNLYCKFQTEPPPGGSDFGGCRPQSPGSTTTL